MSHSNYNSWLTKVTLLLVSTLSVMAAAIAPCLPAMQEYFNEVSNATLWIKLVLTLPALFIVIGSLIAGILVDYFGRKLLLVTSVALYGLAGTSGFVLNSLFDILIGRAFLGLAVAGIIITSTTLIADYYKGQARGSFLGLQVSFMGFGGVLFLSLSGFLADQNWRYPFLIYFLAWLLLPLILWTITEPESTITSNNEENISNTAFPIKLLAFLYGVALLTQMIFYLIPVQLPFYLKDLVKANASRSGLALALTTLFGALSSLFYGTIKKRLDFFSILILVFGLQGLGYIFVALAHQYELVLVGLSLTGVGLGLLRPNLNLWIVSEVSDAVRGRALGGSTMFLYLGQFLSPLVTQPVSQAVGLGITYALAGGLMLICGLILMSLRRAIYQ
ncbi:MFS transporter [Aphanothece hegewaldii CCALA 016]|uniref:MFS transporter n=1 Tax=Aphanothece hegewaldii CCALA 016 TaxID=2107694 RepID=A0A2T1LU66_9CHRO|nr:MFS transporter [Aphanothece hegewaldii]PSF34996.1 MFS transporter [Aphanothece hegewaldii CCALA 016]